MSLYLIEGFITELQAEKIGQSLDVIAAAAINFGAELIEAQVGEDLQRLFVVIDALEPAIAQKSFEAGGLATTTVKPVRLLGQDLTTLKGRKHNANYLVEWNLPAGLTMEAYLQRKAEKSPLYAQVPQVKFERTYICEDLSKCLCLYESPDESTVRQAREILGVPIDALTSIRNLH
jgi:hypothetical protein